MKKALIALFVLILVFIIFIGGTALYRGRDRHAGYSLDVKLPSKIPSQGVVELKIGVAKKAITPNVEDTWVDVDGNARFEPSKGDSFIDKNGNGKFDAYWLAGFQNNRPAAGIHDDIWARAVVFDDGTLRIAFVVLDAIGFFHDDVITVREMVAQKNWGINHVIVASTHNHEVPDLIGMWGPKFYKTGVNQQYLHFVQEQAVKAIGEAFATRRPAYIKLAKIDSTASDLVRDSRPPYILDDTIHLMQFCDAQTDSVFGLLMNWGDHPETLASDNLYITADFPHYWIEGIEKGIQYDGELKRAGIGGTVIFANGAVGGLMTTLGCNVYDPWLDKHFKEGSFEKARAQGYRLAGLVLDKIQKGEWERVNNPQMRLVAKTFFFPVANKYFKLGGLLGVLNRSFPKFKNLRSEIDLLTIGDAWILMIPGEINPEIVNGGIEVPEGADYPEGPIEVPPIRQMMKGTYNFVIGLANDEVGYIMPKSHWDTKPPYTYGSRKGFYGEVNSLGPETGPIVHRMVKEVIGEMQ